MPITSPIRFSYDSEFSFEAFLEDPWLETQVEICGTCWAYFEINTRSPILALLAQMSQLTQPIESSYQ